MKNLTRDFIQKASPENRRRKSADKFLLKYKVGCDNIYAENNIGRKNKRKRIGNTMGFGKLNLKIEKIYNDYGKMILNIAYKTLGDVRLAEDAVQESILRMMKYSNKISKLDGNELKNYVARITRNVCNDIRKRKSKEKLTYDFEEIESICDDCNLEDYVIDKESVNILKSEICKLNSKYRDPLTLHKLQNYTIKEVAELLNVPERTVKLRINKAITMLKSVLTEGADIDGK